MGLLHSRLSTIGLGRRPFKICSHQDCKVILVKSLGGSQSLLYLLRVAGIGQSAVTPSLYVVLPIVT